MLASEKDVKDFQHKELAAVLRVLYGFLQECPPVKAPSKFSPKKFSVAQIYTLVHLRRVGAAYGLVVRPDTSEQLKSLYPDRADEFERLVPTAQRLHELLMKFGKLTYRGMIQML